MDMLRYLKRVNSLVGDVLLGEFPARLGLPVKRLATPRIALEQWLRALGSKEKLPVAKERVLIPALRNCTWIEWAAFCACVIRQMGYSATLAFYGEEIARLYPARNQARNFWARVAAIPDAELIDLSTMAVDPKARTRLKSLAREWAPVAVAYDHHVEEAHILDNLPKHQREIEAIVERTVVLASGMETLLRTRKFHRCFLSSGLIGESKVLLDVLRAAGQETVCLEGWTWRPGHMVYNHNAAALDINVRGWLQSLEPWNEAREKEINTYLQFLDGESHSDAAWLSNYYVIQKSKISSEMPQALAAFLEGNQPVFLLATNVIGDSGTFRCETIFRGQEHWIREVMRYFRQRPDWKLIVRAHPAEVWAGAKCGIKMGDVARSAAAGLRNVFVIDGTQTLNTFSLLPFTRGGMTWISSVGTDMVVRGVPVVAAARPKYTGLGIVEEPRTREEYFAIIERWARKQDRPTSAQIVAGKKYLYIIFIGFSFEATSPNYRATGCRLGAMPNQAQRDRFYRILLGEEPMPDQRNGN